MSTVASANMSLPVPVVGEEIGPDWARDLNNCMTIIDQHDHAAGNGVQITPDGLNINAALAMNDNILNSIAALTLTAQVSFATNKSVYVIGNEIYYRDGAGNQVQITNAGSVNAGAGSITGLPSGTASASYSAVAQKFIWQSATSTPANMDFAAAIFRNLSASSFGLTLSPPAAMGADYDITLPTLPASAAFLQISNTGAISASPAVSGGLTTTNLSVTAGILKSQLAALGQQISTVASFSTSSTSFVNVTNLSVTITTSGRPVYLCIVPSTAGTECSVQTQGNSTPGAFIAFNTQYRRGNTTIADMVLGATQGSASETHSYTPPSTIDAVAAGTYTYTIRTKVSAASSTIFWSDVALMAYEL